MALRSVGIPYQQFYVKTCIVLHFFLSFLLIQSFTHSSQGNRNSIGSGQKRQGWWKRVKKRWNRKGVVEVDIDHHRYELLNAIREAIQDLISNHSELGPKVSIIIRNYRF